MSFSVLISEIIRTKDVKSLNRINNTPVNYLNDTERKALEFVNKHISDYKEFPTSDAFCDEGFRSVYREDFKGDSLDYLYEKFINNVREQHAKRMLADIELSLASGKGLSEKDLIEKINKLPRVTVQHTKNLSESFSEELFLGANIEHGFNLGFSEIDDATGYLSKGRVFAFIAHPANGKTTFLTVMATKAFVEGKKVLYCTFEQPESEISQNIFACLGKYDTKLYNSKFGSADFLRLQELKNLVRMRINYYERHGSKLTILECQNKNIGKIKEYLIKEAEESGKPYDLVIFDNGVYLMPHDTLAGWQKYEDNMQSIKQLAMGDKDMNLDPLAVLISSQFDNKSNGESAGDIAKTQTIQQTCDVVIGILQDTSKLPDGRILKLLKNRSRGRTHGVAQQVEIDFSQTMIKQSSGLSSYSPLFEINNFGLIIVDEDEEDDVANETSE